MAWSLGRPVQNEVVERYPYFRFVGAAYSRYWDAFEDLYGNSSERI